MTARSNISWFHCGRCGSLFQSPAGDLPDRHCTACGRNPSLGIESPAAESGPAWNDGEESAKSKHSLRKRKRSHFMTKLLTAWVLFLVTIVFSARFILNHSAGNPKAFVGKAPAGPPVVSAVDTALLNEVTPQCSRIFADFLYSGTPEERNQFVLSPITTAGRMARFYSLNPIVNLEPRSLSLESRAVVHIPGRRAIETRWNATGGTTLDAVFVEESGEWRLDWDHFARFSDYPWALFLAGSEKDQGEFRLLARERLADERKHADAISIVLYAPRFGTGIETGFQSPEFLVKRDTRSGRLLDAAFKLERSGKRVFGVHLAEPNPEGLIRVRVKVRRIEENMERRFELEEVIACHWYTTEDPGVEIPEQEK